ncbi:Hypothetical predicted protein [Cloeon dipterum]|uniref:Uncharacterized protein n=1 Tax=Cloeon dipterum TaxID=197152 RepID=A0A8S1D988_9INSE|nr:Hypothetical predicted protein [Cloeon dipterum]
MDRWTGRVAIVTGSSAGIGAAIARLLVENSLRVVGVARRDERVQELAEELKKEGAKGELFAIKGDVTNEEDIKRVVKWTRENLGGADVLINNAGVAPDCPLTKFSSKNFRQLYDTNVVGLALFTREVIQDMRSRGIDDGHIFNINSICGHSIIEMPEVGAYSGTKYAITALTEGLRRELRDLKTKIRVTSISPGIVRTEIAEAAGVPKKISDSRFDENPCLEAKDVADAVLYALSAPPHVQVHELIIRPVGESF